MWRPIQLSYARGSRCLLLAYLLEMILRFSIILLDGAIFEDFSGDQKCRRRDPRLVCSGFVKTFWLPASLVAITELLILISLLYVNLHIGKFGVREAHEDIWKMLALTQCLTLAFPCFYLVFLFATWESIDQRSKIASIFCLLMNVSMLIRGELGRRSLKTLSRSISTQEQSMHAMRLQQLPKVRFGTIMSQAAAETQCVICLNELQADDSVIQLPCGHVNHASCLLTWFEDPRHCCCPMKCPEDPLALADDSHVSTSIVRAPAPPDAPSPSPTRVGAGLEEPTALSV